MSEFECGYSPMLNFRTVLSRCFLIVIVSLGVGFSPAIAQLQEPEVKKTKFPKTPLSEDLHNSVSFDFFVTNFGFGLGGHYTRVVGPYTELTFRTGITGIRNVSEQTFQNAFNGRRVIPNKYKRALGFPFIIGVKQRLFAEQIADNFRFFVGGGAGPAMAFTYPYVKDNNNNGFRDFEVIPIPGTQQGRLRPREDVNDFFSGWSKGNTHWGMSGEIKIGVDFGKSFSSRTTVELGYFFYYFKEGLQILEPYKPFGYTAPSGTLPGQPIDKRNGNRNSFNQPQKLFGTPQIKITFGGLW
ncbi:hypothetical protein LX73_1828 [Fodinibius salinus]|uniref:Uncharacterized protein n=1 Tax=Fodinibius salinus TaxID=860790 RepID=A0A5D3YJZ6_9BACT|nr:hypothetical protein [Fodinibius salinus]TYP94103.1 hypothetical protein LX73_1828 [Fodinibius salinus]